MQKIKLTKAQVEAINFAQQVLFERMDQYEREGKETLEVLYRLQITELQSIIEPL